MKKKMSTFGVMSLVFPGLGMVTSAFADSDNAIKATQQLDLKGFNDNTMKIKKSDVVFDVGELAKMEPKLNDKVCFHVDDESKVIVLS